MPNRKIDASVGELAIENERSDRKRECVGNSSVAYCPARKVLKGRPVGRATEISIIVGVTKRVWNTCAVVCEGIHSLFHIYYNHTTSFCQHFFQKNFLMN
jgi:hypothetical protein